MVIDKASERLVIVMPAYNEAANLASVATAWHAIVARYGGAGSCLLLLDDGSRDETWAIAQELQQTLPLLMCHHHDNCGHGETIRRGYQMALDLGADYIFQTDSDGQTMPEEFDLLWHCRHDFTALIGHRVKREDGISRRIVAAVLKNLIWLVFGVSVPDANTPFRLIQRDALVRCLKQIPAGFNLTNALLAILLAWYGEPVKYIRVSFRKRQGGKNSINLRRILAIGWQTALDFVAIRRTLQ